VREHLSCGAKGDSSHGEARCPTHSHSDIH
jgi:hypothetical protein